MLDLKKQFENLNSLKNGNQLRTSSVSTHQLDKKVTKKSSIVPANEPGTLKNS